MRPHPTAGVPIGVPHTHGCHRCVVPPPSPVLMPCVGAARPRPGGAARGPAGAGGRGRAVRTTGGHQGTRRAPGGGPHNGVGVLAPPPFTPSCPYLGVQDVAHGSRHRLRHHGGRQLLRQRHRGHREPPQEPAARPGVSTGAGGGLNVSPHTRSRSRKVKGGSPLLVPVGGGREAAPQHRHEFGHRVLQREDDGVGAGVEGVGDLAGDGDTVGGRDGTLGAGRDGVRATVPCRTLVWPWWAL